MFIFQVEHSAAIVNARTGAVISWLKIFKIYALRNADDTAR